MTNWKTESLLVQLGRPQGVDQPLNVPLVPASNFILGADSVYSREDGTPTWRAFEDTVSALEGGTALAFGSGMAAAAAVFDQLPTNATVVLPEDCYQGVVTLANLGEKKGRWTIQRLATDDTGSWIAAAEGADLLWMETPSNPLLMIADLAAVAAAPRKSGGLLAVDNTFATPINQQPLLLGADISMHSATKFMGGHSDLLAGVLVAKKEELVDQLRLTRTVSGGVPGTLEMFLAARGMRTLAIRLERAQENAMALALFLTGHPCVQNVYYPGLSTHPQHGLAAEQLGGFGAMLSFETTGDRSNADAACRSTRLIHHATSLGSVETTMERRAVHGGQEHIPATLLRISVGIEHSDDLIADLDQALRSTCPIA